MDKRVIFAVAGSGKTTHIINSLNNEKRSLIITYTNANYNNIISKIECKFNGIIPNNIKVLKYFNFLYSFCYKPFLADKIHAKGILFEPNTNRISHKNIRYYLTKDRYIYSNRLAYFFNYTGIIEDIKRRIERYFDAFIIDEIQDISGRDFNFLTDIMSANMEMLYVGDFFQHTYDTSRDGNVNNNLFNNFRSYELEFTSRGFVSDKTTLVKSWRCCQNICDFITNNLSIKIESNNQVCASGEVRYIHDNDEKNRIWQDDNIIKLHYNNSKKYGVYHKNWGETKGEDCYKDVCIVLNKSTYKLYNSDRLKELPPSTRNRLYVALTRARRNVFLIDDN